MKYVILEGNSYWKRYGDGVTSKIEEASRFTKKEAEELIAMYDINQHPRVKIISDGLSEEDVLYIPSVRKINIT